ncbi:MAG: hypothetical protein LC105_06180 [Chitinophagales bacterium]|nr:hypothetical protein [Chitinophagales bacterium]
MKGILLDDNFDLSVKNGHLDFGEATIQEVGLLLGLNKGELKDDPRLGPNLIEKIRSTKTSMSEIQQIAKRHLAMDGKDYDDLKDKIRFHLSYD